jgi:multidrug efflux pump subunit AcrA (membrane-fusion protein)
MPSLLSLRPTVAVRFLVLLLALCAWGTARAVEAPSAAELDNAVEKLAPGQYLNVTLTLDTLRDAVVVPDEAIQQGPDGSFVYVLKADAGAEVRALPRQHAELWQFRQRDIHAERAGTTSILVHGAGEIGGQGGARHQLPEPPGGPNIAGDQLAFQHAAVGQRDPAGPAARDVHARHRLLQPDRREDPSEARLDTLRTGKHALQWLGSHFRNIAGYPDLDGGEAACRD